MARLRVEMVSAEELMYSGEASMVVATAHQGEIGVLPGHAPFLALLKPGQVRLHQDHGQEEVFYISGGFIEVQPGQVTILGDTVSRAGDLDEAKALAARERAEQMLKDQHSDLDYAHASAELAQAIAQIQAIKKLRSKK